MILKGYRTYVLGGLIVISAILYGFGIVDKAAFDVLISVFGGGAVVALRAGIKAS